MKKVILFLICLVFLPSITSAYYSEEQFRTDIMNYIRSESYRQAQDDILNNQYSSNQQFLDTYYQSVGNLEKEYQLKLKTLELEESAAKRAEAWEKEKQLLDQQLKLIKEKAEFEAQRKAFETEKNSDDLVKYMQGVTDQIIKDREIKEKSVTKNISSRGIKPPREIKPFQYEKSVTTNGNPEINDLLESFKNNTPAIEPTATTPIEVPAPKRNIFYRFWSKIINFF